MKKVLCFAIMMASTAVFGPAVFAQDDPPPVFTSSFTYQTYDRYTGDIIEFDPSTYILWEGEIVRMSWRAFDPSWNDASEGDVDLPIHFAVIGEQVWPLSGPPVLTNPALATGLWALGGNGSPPAAEGATADDIEMSLAFQIPKIVGRNVDSIPTNELHVGLGVEVSIGDVVDDCIAGPSNGSSTLSGVLQIRKLTSIDMPNPAPVADAGPDQIAEAGDVVLLDASRTTDLFNRGFDLETSIELDTLTFTWETISAPTGVDRTALVPAAVADPSEYLDEIFEETPSASPFAEIQLDAVGNYVFRVTVSDNVRPTPSTDIIQITVVDDLGENIAPIAVINGPLSSVEVGDTVTLTGIGSFDPNAGDTLTYLWQQTDELGNVITAETADTLFQPLSGITSDTISWQTTAAGSFNFRLMISDGDLSDSKDFTVQVVTPGSVQNAGAQVSINDQNSQDGNGNTPADTLAETPRCGLGLSPLLFVTFAICFMRGRRRY